MCCLQWLLARLLVGDCLVIRFYLDCLPLIACWCLLLCLYCLIAVLGFMMVV